MPATPQFILCIPVYNDWDVVGLLLGHLDQILRQQEGKFSVLLVDDGSSEPLPQKATSTWSTFQKIEILKLRRNLGHQRAIAIGLSYIYAHRPCDAVVVMDGDGQDAPEQVPILLSKYRELGGKKAIFAKRSKRVESVIFSFLYHSYKILHWALTGKRVEVGNFSVVPFTALTRLMASSELWNHYAAAVMKTRLPVEKIPLPRTQRLRNRSQMSFVDLVMHGLSGISVFSEEMCVRALIFASSVMVVLVAAAAAIFWLQYAAQAQIPILTIVIIGLLFLGFLNALILVFIFAFVILQRRSNLNFLPLRDFEYYITEMISLT